MKFLVIFLIIGMAMFMAYNDAFGWCDQNEDWPDAPCYAPYQAQQIESQEDWEKYYDYKGSEWMDSKKLELIHAIQTDTLDEWITESDDQSHENVYVYYSIFDDLEEYKISPEPNVKLTPFALYFQEEDFTTQGPNHNILVLEEGESSAVTVHVKNNDEVPHRITLKNPDSDSVFSSFVFEPKEILVLPNGTNSTKLHMTIANKTDTHTTFVTFLGQSDSFGMRGLGFYLAVEKEDREIDYEFIDRSMRAGLPGGAFPDLDTDISEHEAEMSISNGFGSPRYLPEGYEFQGMDGWENKRFVYSKAPILTESTGFQQFWDEGGILIIYGVDGPNVNNTASLPFKVAQNEGQQIMINGLMGDAVENHTRTVAYSDIEYGVPSDVYFFDDAKKASVFLRANIPLDELLKVAASIPVPNAVSTNYFSEQGYEIFSVVEGAYEYNVPYKITGAKLNSMGLDCDGTEIIIGLESSDGGTLVVNIPRKMLDTRFNNFDDEFILIMDGKETAFDEIYSNVESRTLKIPFSKGLQVLEIIITQLISQDPKSQVTCGQMGPEESPYYDLLSPLKQIKAGIPIDKIQCKEGLELILKSFDGSPACVSSESIPKLVERRWGVDYESLVSMIENSDEIITAMVVGEEILPNGNRHVWLGTYEWLKSGVYDENQLFLEQDKTSNPQALNVKFSRGEEVLLFVKAIDEKRGAYDIFPTGDTPPQKYPISIRGAIMGITKPDYSGIKEFDFSSAKGCSQKDLDGDSYWHCSSNTPFYAPIEKTMSLVKEEILRHISEQYFDEHFDLVSTHDVSVVNGKETPVGQSITFVYTIDDMRFVYSADTNLEREFDEVYLRFVPPKQLDSIMHDDKQIEKLAYSCLDSEDYKIYWQPHRIANHMDEGFSPIIVGAGPPTVYDRWGDDPIQRNEKTFRIWLANGEVECREYNAGEFEPDKLARQENILLIDSTEFQRIKNSN